MYGRFLGRYRDIHDRTEPSKTKVAKSSRNRTTTSRVTHQENSPPNGILCAPSWINTRGKGIGRGVVYNARSSGVIECEVIHLPELNRTKSFWSVMRELRLISSISNCWSQRAASSSLYPREPGSCALIRYRSGLRVDLLSLGYPRQAFGSFRQLLPPRKR